jgi:hypothetical protein
MEVDTANDPPAVVRLARNIAHSHIRLVSCLSPAIGKLSHNPQEHGLTPYGAPHNPQEYGLTPYGTVRSSETMHNPQKHSLTQYRSP